MTGTQDSGIKPIPYRTIEQVIVDRSDYGERISAEAPLPDPAEWFLPAIPSDYAKGLHKVLRPEDRSRPTDDEGFDHYQRFGRWTICSDGGTVMIEHDEFSYYVQDHRITEPWTVSNLRSKPWLREDWPNFLLAIKELRNVILRASHVHQMANR